MRSLAFPQNHTRYRLPNEEIFTVIRVSNESVHIQHPDSSIEIIEIELWHDLGAIAVNTSPVGAKAENSRDDFYTLGVAPGTEGLTGIERLDS